MRVRAVLEALAPRQQAPARSVPAWGWGVAQTIAPSGYVQTHTTPICDIRLHRATPACECRPEEDPMQGDHWVHRAFDRRERHEAGAPLH